MKRFEKYEPQVGEVVEVDRGNEGVFRCRAVLVKQRWWEPCSYCIGYKGYNGYRGFPCDSVICGIYGGYRSDGEQIVLQDVNEIKEDKEEEEEEED